MIELTDVTAIVEAIMKVEHAIDKLGLIISLLSLAVAIYIFAMLS